MVPYAFYNNINETYLSYCSIIEKTTELVNKLNITDPNEQFFVFTYLLWNNYFCLKPYEHIEIDYEDDLVSLGMQVMNGYGVCRHNSQLLTDLLINLKQDAKEVGVFYKLSKIEKPMINHSVVLVKDKATMLYDPTNIIIGEVNYFGKFKNYINNDQMILKPFVKNPYGCLKFIYNEEMINSQKNKIKNLCILKKKLIQQYHQDIISDIEKVITR